VLICHGLGTDGAAAGDWGLPLSAPGGNRGFPRRHWLGIGRGVCVPRYVLARTGAPGGRAAGAGCFSAGLAGLLPAAAGAGSGWGGDWAATRRQLMRDWLSGTDSLALLLNGPGDLSGLA